MTLSGYYAPPGPTLERRGFSLYSCVLKYKPNEVRFERSDPERRDPEQMSSLTNSQLILNGGNATLDASSASTLDFQGGTGDPDITGIETLTFSGAINTGTPIGGHCMCFRGERGTATASGNAYSMGNGNTRLAGCVMPQAGSVLAISITTDTSSTATIAIIGSSSGTLISTSLAASSSNSTTVAAGAAPFVSGEQIYAQITSGTVNGVSCCWWMVRFD
jgi:hypothetical protein